MFKVYVLAAVSLLYSGFVFAADDEESITDEMYYGIKLNSLSFSFEGFDPASNQSYFYEEVASLGALVGFKVDQNIMLEADLSTNIGAGEIRTNGSNNGLDWGVTTIGLHGVYKGDGTSHVRIKAGITHTTVSNPGELGSLLWMPDDSSTGMTFGVGYGFNTSSGKEFVVEWTQVSEDFTALSVGLNF